MELFTRTRWRDVNVHTLSANPCNMFGEQAQKTALNRKFFNCDQRWRALIRSQAESH